MAAGLFTTSGDCALAKFLYDNVSHVAIGSGNWPDPFNPTVEQYNDDALYHEIGRVPVALKQYLMEDPNGTITFLGDGTLYRVATPQEVAAR
jgi:hypothetical protein